MIQSVNQFLKTEAVDLFSQCRENGIETVGVIIERDNMELEWKGSIIYFWP